MKFRQARTRWALWAFVAALILRAAMPLLASASAGMQGRTMVEVCSVYGVAMVPLDGPVHHDHAPAPMPDHGGEHCALTALAALGAPSVPVVSAAPIPPQHTGPPRAPPSRDVRDACADWVARLKHGPPAIA